MYDEELLVKCGFVFDKDQDAYKKIIYSKRYKNTNGEYVSIGVIYLDATGVECILVSNLFGIIHEFDQLCIDELNAVGIQYGQ